ncbi:MAG: hypothetical protein JJE27_05270 [Thermoleophilia bacterium]|nr:hypothetical protein [Thermoleophilia bacterium]
MVRLTTKFVLSMAIVACVTAIPAGNALASSASLIKDCNADGSIDGKYSASDLKNALSSLPADVDQYSDCRSLINQALLNKVSKHGRGHGSDLNSLNQITTAGQRRQAAAQARASANERLPADGSVAKIGGAKVARSGARTLASSAAPGVPAALIVAVAGLLLLLGGDLAGRAINLPGVERFGRKLRRRGN